MEIHYGAGITVQKRRSTHDHRMHRFGAQWVVAYGEGAIVAGVK